jgi:hypothetical protein
LQKAAPTLATPPKSAVSAAVVQRGFAAAVHAAHDVAASCEASVAPLPVRGAPAGHEGTAAAAGAATAQKAGEHVPREPSDA